MRRLLALLAVLVVVAASSLSQGQAQSVEAVTRITGDWGGEYWGAGNQRTAFQMRLWRTAPDTFQGDMVETNTFADRRFATLSARLVGRIRSDGFFVITKRYDGVAGQNHSVTYYGTVSGSQIIGDWTLENVDGLFEASRISGARIPSAAPGAADPTPVVRSLSAADMNAATDVVRRWQQARQNQDCTTLYALSCSSGAVMMGLTGVCSGSGSDSALRGLANSLVRYDRVTYRLGRVMSQNEAVVAYSGDIGVRESWGGPHVYRPIRDYWHNRPANRFSRVLREDGRWKVC